jgi:hypothetical protein
MKGIRGYSAVVVFFSLILASTTAQSQGLFDRVKGLFTSQQDDAAALTAGEISGALRDALRVGTERVVSTLGRTDGFNAAPDVHIPLPGTLQKVQKVLGKVGMSGMADDLELRINRAAEAAVPKAKGLFADAISQMTIDDARAILNGPDDSATRYFQDKMSAPLSAEMKPVIEKELASAGAIKAYDSMMGQYRSLPYAQKVEANLTDYALGKTVDGIFLYLGREEAAIRQDPAKRTTELLRKVFGK